MDEFTAPVADAEQVRFDFRWRLGKSRAQQLIRMVPDDLLFRPAVHLLGSAVPEGNGAAHVTDEDALPRQVKQLNVSPQLDVAVLVIFHHAIESLRRPI